MGLRAGRGVELAWPGKSVKSVDYTRAVITAKAAAQACGSLEPCNGRASTIDIESLARSKEGIISMRLTKELTTLQQIKLMRIGLFSYEQCMEEIRGVPCLGLIDKSTCSV